MKISLEWGRPLKLRDGTRHNLIYTVILDKLSKGPGIYVFGRRWGTNAETLYVGKANTIRGRVKGQLNNARRMQHLKNAKPGKRMVIAGEVKTKPGQKLEKVLRLAEKTFVRHFIAEAHDLLNKHGARIRRGEISCLGKQPKRPIPNLAYLEKTKGE